MITSVLSNIKNTINNITNNNSNSNKEKKEDNITFSNIKKILKEELEKENSQEKEKINKIISLIDYIPNNTKDTYFEIIHVNPNIYLAHRGARICVGKGPLEDFSLSYTDKSRYISKVLANQHESILEHTNIIGIFHINNITISKYLSDYTIFLSNLKYCNIISKNMDKSNETIILIGGSIRSFIHCIRETNINNYFVNNLLKPFMYSTIEKEFLINLIKDNLLEEDKCTYVTNTELEENENGELISDFIYEPEEKDLGERVTLIYATDIRKIYNSFNILKKYFTIKELMKVCTVSFLFHDISRSCSHQLVRHRNGISQESQRYVSKDYNYKDNFVDPIQLNINDKYKEEEISQLYKYISLEDNIFDVYKELIRLKVEKEDARAWLPTNVKTQLIMTFTYWSFAKFLQLRLDKHAQKEIRLLAEESSKIIVPTIYDNLDNFINDNCSYGYKDYKDPEDILIEESNDIDEDEIIPMNIDSESKAEEILLQEEENKKLEEKNI